MATLSQAYQSIANMNLWLKVRSGDNPLLSDIPTIIPLRWTYFRDNWEFLKSGVQDKVSAYFDPDFLNQQIIDFTSFIEAQRYSSSTLNPFSDSVTFNKFYAIFDNIAIDDISLTNEEKDLVKNTIAAVQQYSKNDFLKIKQNVEDYRDRYTDTVGLSDDQYNTTFNKASIPPQLTATIVDINALLTLQSAVKTADFILANLFAVDTAVDPFALARANANNPDVNIGSYSSGFLVKLNYGENLESLANRYFGDPNRWIDIAIANGLQPPYIDEIGTSIPLLSNGSGNQINLSETDVDGSLNIDKLYINQPVFLQSTTQVTVDQRSVVSIRQIPVSGEIILELDGAANLDIYHTADNANIRVYQTNTINSGFYILIPSTQPLPDGRNEEIPWFLAKSADDEKRAKVDIAIGENGEINFTTNGDIQLSYGLDNAIQAMRLKIITELGTLRYHPTFGLVNVVGKINSDIAGVKNLITESLNSQVAADSRFDRIESLSVDYLVNARTNDGVAAIAITMAVRLAGGSRVVPISFTVSTT